MLGAHRLRSFHAQCLRVLCHVTRLRTWQEGISTRALEMEFGIESIDMYVNRRQAHWLGHVARMPFERLPRKMLSSWVAAPRQLGGQLMAYGRSTHKVLDALAIPFQSWPTLAADRAAWRDAINGGLLNGGRPRRSKTRDETDRLIAVSLAERCGRLDARLEGLGGLLDRAGGPSSSATTPPVPMARPWSATADARRAVRAPGRLAGPRRRQHRHRAAVTLLPSRVSRPMERESSVESTPRVRMCDPLPCACLCVSFHALIAT